MIQPFKTLRQRLSYNHKASVAAVFNALKPLMGNTDAGQAWLASVERLALKWRPGWKQSIAGALVGLETASPSLAASCAEVRVAMGQCDESGPGAWEMLLPLLAMYALAVWDVLQWFAAPNWVVSVLVLGALFIVGAFWVLSRPWLDRRVNPRRVRTSRWLLALGGGIVVVAAAMEASAFARACLLPLSEHGYQVSVQSLERPDGAFTEVRNLAQRDFGVDLVLSHAPTSWALTSLNVLGTSPARMDVMDGYCDLEANSQTIATGFPAVARIDQGALLRGAMVHELGHCIDIRRDFAQMGSKGWTPHAIAPIDRAGVHDVTSYLKAADRPTTQLWREAFADILAVGFWDLRRPAETGRLSAAFGAARATHAKGDVAHATTCWIAYASLMPGPTDEKALFSWADHLRASAPCSVVGQSSAASVPPHGKAED